MRQALVALFPECAEGLRDVVRCTALFAFDKLRSNSAQYHDWEHTVLVTSAGLAILAGRHEREGLTPTDWAHLVCAMLLHDIGFSRSACRGDMGDEVVAGLGDQRLIVSTHLSDAVLAPMHVDRGMRCACELYEDSRLIDGSRVAAAIEFTRFPVPDEPRYRALDAEGNLVRGADLIGQIADPAYPQKLYRLFSEMQETGAADQAGYRSAADMRNGFSAFYSNLVEPWIFRSLDLLEATEGGRLWARAFADQVDALK